VSKKYTYIESHASKCQIAADEMAYKFVTQQNRVEKLSVIQSICDFNIFWINSLSLVFCHDATLDLLSKNVNTFNRKLNISEFLRYDVLIHHFQITTINQLKEKLK